MSTSAERGGQSKCFHFVPMGIEPHTDVRQETGCIWNCIVPYYIVQYVHYFQLDSEVCIQWTLYYPMRPQEKIYEWQWRNATDAGRSVTTLRRLYVQITVILYRTYSFCGRKVITYSKSTHREYVISDAVTVYYGQVHFILYYAICCNTIFCNAICWLTAL